MTLPSLKLDISVVEKKGSSQKSKQTGLKCRSRPRGYKTFLMLNSAEHEMFSANKYENANNSWHFIFVSREIFMPS